MAEARLADIEVGDDKPVVIVGAINLSPESFYAGSRAYDVGEAVEKARMMIEGGARVIDVGAMATGPGSRPISTEQEMRRLIPAVRALAKEFDAPISVDTQRAAVAEASLEAGAAIINDISGLKADPRMAEVIAGAGCSTILMAAERSPGDVYEVEEIRRALGESLRICEESGIALGRVVLDPGIGYWPARLARLGERAREPYEGRSYCLATHLDLRILARLPELRALGRPLCVSISRKSFIGDILKLPDPADRLAGSLAATVLAVLNGARVVRTHDPKETSQAVRIVEATREAE